MDARVEMGVHASWVNGWFLRVASRAFLRVDGAEILLSWTHPTGVAVEPGQHEIAVGVRYRGFSRLLGARTCLVSVEPGQTLQLRAHNGPLNSDSFNIFQSQ
ncbi:hypothetical protein DEI81_02460 [Curtobacterium sp. MCBD17_013]|nr:hypothetical protein DEI81_02460 [Curtobacterium sp. MCBD17_013]